MNRIPQMFAAMIRDESGGELIEYALVLGLICVAAIGLVTAVGTKVAAPLDFREQQHDLTREDNHRAMLNARAAWR